MSEINENNKTTEALYQALFETTPDAIMIVDDEGRYVDINPALCRILKAPRSRLLGAHFNEFVPEGRLEEAYAAFGDLRTKGVISMEFPLRAADGSLVELEWTSRADFLPGLHLCVAREITERKHAEMALRQSEQELADFFDNAAVGLHWVGPDGYILRANRAELELMGYSREEYVGHHITEFHADAEVIEDILKRLANNETLYNYEARLRAKDGSIRHVLINSNVLWEDGRFVHTRCFTRDITARLNAEQARRASEQRFTKAFHASPLPMTISTLDEGRYLDVNEATRRITGYARAEMIGRTAHELNVWADSEDRNRLLSLLKEQGEVREFEVGLRSKNGEVSIVLMAAELIDLDGQSCILTASSDITERKRAEVAQSFLAEASSILAASLDYSTTLKTLARLTVPKLATYCAIDLADEDGRLRQVAVAHEDSRKEDLIRELRRRNPYNYTLPHGVVKVLQTGKSELSPEIPDSLITSYATDDDYFKIVGELNPKSYMIVPLVARGRSLGVITFVADQTGARYDRKSLELAEDLARRAALAIDNARLYGEVQQANRAKDEFLATVSHELRTPLNAILGWSHILRSSKLDEAATANAHVIIERNARAQARLIEDILDISRIITGKLRLDARPVSLDSVVSAAVEAMRPAADVKKISIEAVIDPATCAVTGDANRLQQVLWNLLSNAIKFTPNGGRVAVKLDHYGSSARLTVSDTGQGISKEFLPYVFDRFRQADSTSTRKHSGLGLGLAIVRHLVQLHNGAVQAQSEGEGLGATFVITLPLAGLKSADGNIEFEQLVSGEAGGAFARAQELKAQESKDQESKARDRQSEMLEGLRIVIVDDQTDTLEMLKASLAAWGASVSVAATARHALKLVIESRPHVLVSDLGLPEEDGYDLIRQVRELAPESGGLVPAIALTAYARAEDRKQALAAGFQIHMTKPVEPVELAVVIAGLAGRTVKGLGA